MSEPSKFFKDYHDYVGSRPDRYAKATLFENEAVLVGMNCLDPGQSMQKHAHEKQNRFYLVLEGNGLFRVGDQEGSYGPGTVAWIPAGNTHQIHNLGNQMLVMMVGIAPGHAD
jgi:quercetin dioxygenase-like cupin family protein